MSQSMSPKRPWLAALLSALVTGLGHLYLRRWRRALGWLAVAIGVSAFFVDPAALESLVNGTLTDPLAVAPLLVVSSLCVADAYVLARTQNVIRRVTPTADGELTHCPYCGKELDADLSFCQWCSTDLEDFEDEALEDTSQRS